MLTGIGSNNNRWKVPLRLNNVSLGALNHSCFLSQSSRDVGGWIEDSKRAKCILGKGDKDICLSRGLLEFNRGRNLFERSPYLTKGSLLRPNYVKYHTSSTSLECKKCHAPMRGCGLICGRCDTIVDRDEIGDWTAFEILGVPAKYDLDLDMLNKRYKDLQRLMHPDIYPNAQHTNVGILSARLSTAMAVLRSPDQRAIEVLRSKGISHGEGAEITDMDVIMNILVVNEELDDIETLESSKEQERLLVPIITHWSKMAQDAEKEILDALANLEVSPYMDKINKQKAEAIMQLVGKRRLIYRVENRIREIQECWDVD